MTGGESVAQIKDLPYVSYSKYSPVRYQLCCYVLYIERSTKNSGPLAIFVTDFTDNQHLLNPRYPKGVELDEKYTLNDEKILRIDVFEEQFNQLALSYEQQVGSSLFPDMESSFDLETRRYKLVERFWILSPVIALKVYNSTIEARCKDLKSINSFENRVILHSLYGYLSQLPGNILHTGRLLRQRKLPFDDQSFQSQVETFSSTEIKREPDHDELITDTLFADDYEGSQSEEIDDQSSLEEHLQEEQRFKNKGTPSYQELNSMLQESMDNGIYNVEGYIVGSNPDDWSLLCAKTYGLNPVSQTIEPEDPFARSVELILVDSTRVDNMQNHLTLSKANSIVLHLDGEQILNFTESISVESLYTRVATFGYKFHANRPMSVFAEIYKKEIPINEETNTKVWTVKSFTPNILT